MQSTSALKIVLTAFVCSFLLASCGGRPPVFKTETSAAVEEYTRLHIGRLDPVTVVFRDELPESVNDDKTLQAILTLSPPVKGTVNRTGMRTVEFRPSEPYKSEKTYSIGIDTGILAGMAPHTEGFVYTITVRQPEYSFMPEGLSADRKDNAETLSFSGLISTDIGYDLKTYRQMVTVKLGGKTVPVQWSEPDRLTASAISSCRRFTIQNLRRGEKPQYLSVTVNGKPIGAARSEEQKWLIPAEEAFEVVEIDASQSSCFTVRFSDRIDPSQDIRGFVRSDAVASQSIRYDIDGNVLRLYAGRDWRSGEDIQILEGIKSESGKVLKIPASAQRPNEWDKPSVRFLTQGVILPVTDGVTLPIETVNLSGVIVQVYLIQNANMMQFLQVNELDGANELYRVATPVWSKSFDFAWDDTEKNQNIRRGLDLTDLVKRFPGGMYQIRVSFRKHQVHYECSSAHDFSNLPFPSDQIPVNPDKSPYSNEESSYWDYSDRDYSAYQNYWSFRNDPCHPAFYMDYYNENITVRKNVLISNIGVMAKADGDGTLLVTLSDIGTTDPVANAAVKIYNYAQKELASGKSDANGSVSFTITPQSKTNGRLGGTEDTARPYFVSASKNGQLTVMRIDTGTSLSTSHFEVGGDNLFTGTKGFIYGERGVWRPGDPIYLTFILQDKSGKLPSSHPVQFQLRNPQGLVTRTQILTSSENGFYRVDTGTAPDDPTGTWTARFTVGGKSWSKNLKVETVVPNRLSIKLKPEHDILRPKNNAFTLEGAWLHGAPAPGLEADVSAAFWESPEPFSSFSAYTFKDPSRTVGYDTETVWKGTLDNASRAQFSIDLYAGSGLPGKLKAQLITRIFEQSGAYSIEQAVFDYSPYDRYVGLKLPKGDATRNMLLTDTPHTAEVVVVNAEGVPVSDQTVVSMNLYKLDWRWWWEKDAYQDVSSYTSGKSYKLVSSGKAVTKDGRASWDFQVNYPEWGRYLVVARDEEGGHSSASIVYIDWPGWAGRSAENNAGSSAMVTLVPDKTLYVPGDTALVSFSAGGNSRALITIEKAGRIVKQEWMECASGVNTYKLKITGDMAPNVYAHVTLLQKHLQTANDLPVRLYGVTPVMVEEEKTRLNPVIAMPAQIEPGQKTQITVSEKNGRPMTFTLAVVDEGLLGLTAYRTPNPWNEFFKKEGSTITSWDIYNYVMNAYSGKLQTLLAIGGGDSAIFPNGADKNLSRFTPVVKYFGPYTIEARGSKLIEFDMPAYVGAVRAMAVAGGGGAFGVAEQSAPVKASLMTQTLLPRTMGLDEIVDMPITIFSDNEVERKLSIKIVTSGSLRVEHNGKLLTDAELTQTLPSGGEHHAAAKIRSVSEGAGTVTISTAFPGDTSRKPYTETITLEVQSRGTLVKNAVTVTVPRGQTEELSVVMSGQTGTRKVYLELSPQPPIDLEGRLSYLIGYPHGCIEQITSGGFPQLYIAKLSEMSRERVAMVTKNVQSVIDRYPTYQTVSGGFAYWPGGQTPNDWGTNYAGHFMIEARKAGYTIPDSTFTPWLEYQKKHASSWRGTGYDDSERVQAYRLFTLALAGSPDIGSMNRLRSEKKLSNTAAWYLAASYYLAGQRQEARNTYPSLSLTTGRYRETGGTYGSNLRDTAIILNCLTIMEDNRRVTPLITEVAEALGNGSWMSTQETAYCLMALVPYYSADSNDNEGNTGYAYSWNGNEYTGTLKKNIQTIELSDAGTPRATVAVRNAGQKPLYARLVGTGKITPGEEISESRLLMLTVTYKRNGFLVRPSDLRAGDTVRISTTVTNTGNPVKNVALTVPVPTGWEIVNTRVGSDSDKNTGGVNSAFTYQDIRDNAVLTYFDIDAKAGKTFTFDATVVHTGQYYLPAVTAGAMYDDNISAVSPGVRITQTAQ